MPFPLLSCMRHQQRNSQCGEKLILNDRQGDSCPVVIRILNLSPLSHRIPTQNVPFWIMTVSCVRCVSCVAKTWILGEWIIRLPRYTNIPYLLLPALSQQEISPSLTDPVLLLSFPLPLPHSPWFTVHVTMTGWSLFSPYSLFLLSFFQSWKKGRHWIFGWQPNLVKHQHQPPPFVACLLRCVSESRASGVVCVSVWLRDVTCHVMGHAGMRWE